MIKIPDDATPSMPGPGAGFMLALGYCCGCGHQIAFNALKVPSLRVNGVREPVCIGCFNIVNENRRRDGLPPNLLQRDAYQPCGEGGGP